MAWRYCDCPYRTYQLTLAERAEGPAGYAVYSILRTTGRRRCSSRKSLRPDSAALQALIRDVVARATAADADTVATLAVSGSHIERELRRAGFLSARGGWPVEVIQLDPALPRAALRDPEGWWLVGGDFDVI